MSAPITIRSAFGNLTEAREVAEAFNKFSVDKISNLKANIDPNFVKDPLTKIAEKMKHKNLDFKIRTVSASTVMAVITFIGHLSTFLLGICCLLFIVAHVMMTN